MSSHRYLPHTDEDVARMLEACGATSLDDLYSDVPASLRLKAPYALPASQSEPEVDRFFGKAASANREMKIFAGAGYYHHFTPAAIPALLSRSEFQTAYTPYQPEISQGTLQYIFEYQSMLCSLTGMDVCNASMYDGATATAEAVIMAVASARKKKRVLVSQTVNPAVRQVVYTYATAAGIIIEEVPEEDGVTSRRVLEEQLGAGDVAAVLVSSPNYYGILEDFSGVADLCHVHKSLLIMNCEAAALGTIKSPGEWGADIACGEAQSLGMPLNYGGPCLGYLCCKQALMRKLPGRIVGATTDSEGRRAFVLTLQAREQHIRRQKATSNICSNQGMMTLHAAMYLALMGAEGLRKVNQLGFDAAHALSEGLTATGKMKLRYPDKPFLHEFAVDTVEPLTADCVLSALEKADILGGVKLTENSLLIAATEMCTPEDVHEYINIVKNLSHE
ncbi:MAG: aminomethyl-transferring glycine dehydrogenase subunit GcvPA [Muribaculaceae bacterium]|nr:aminomethyl-transferring glycine dehydrogenase subunit GcvPA [Muribaculaceae bacterium]